MGVSCKKNGGKRYGTYFVIALSDNRSLRPLFCLFLSGRLRQGFAVLENDH